MDPHDSEPRIMAPKDSRYVWPRYLLAAVLLGLVLAIVWTAIEVSRTRQKMQPQWQQAN